MRRGQRQKVLAVRKGHHGDLRPLQVLLDDDAPAGLPEDFLHHGGPDRLLGLLHGACHRHAFAGGEPVRLNDNRRLLQLDVGEGLIGPLEGDEAPRRYLVLG